MLAILTVNFFCKDSNLRVIKKSFTLGRSYNLEALIAHILKLKEITDLKNIFS